MRSFSVILLVFWAVPALAWDDLGHMTVAEVAYQGLTLATRQHVGALLKLNPQYASWIAGIPTAKQEETAFLRAATWPDFIKKAPGYTNDGDRPSGPDVAANIGYTDKLQHRYWHFVDLPFSPDHTATTPPSVPNAVTQIAAFRTTLSSTTASDALKSYDLVWILHVVGDIHQPLHATSRFTQTQPKGDNGGNLVKVCAPTCNGELHAFWDDILGTSKTTSAAIKLAKKLPAADPTQAAIADENAWATESEQLAEGDVYVKPIGGGAGPYHISAAYKSHAADVARTRIAVAGARLAALLNAALP